MEVEIQEKDAIVVFSLSGEVDGSTAPLAQEQILPFIKENCRLLLNLHKVEFMSSAGLRMLISLQRRVAGKGRLILVELPEHISNTMKVTGFLKLFSICNSQSEGLAQLS
jgi:anti-sigma B factor antagonist